MKIQKINLASMQGKLSRNEMRHILAGSTLYGTNGSYCHTGQSCSVHDISAGRTYSGVCSGNGMDQRSCWCSTDEGAFSFGTISESDMCGVAHG